MSVSFLWSRGKSERSVRRQATGVIAVLFAANIAAWVWAIVALRDHPLLLGTAALAYSFGLRHAFDADHITAIDNVTRKLMQDGKQPVGVGLFFSLGHSTVVVGLSVAIALWEPLLTGRLETLKPIVGMVGVGVSSVFLFAIAFANMLVLALVYRTFRSVMSGGPLDEEDIDLALAKRGFFGRAFRRFFRVIELSWQMYPLGLLFGLGFDTATEIGLLGISASQSSHGLPIWSTLVFPALFTAGMTLMDAANNILMLGAYRWAYVKPIRKLYYNLTITAVSVVIAVVVGSLEALNMIGDKIGMTDRGAFWRMIGGLNDNFGMLGCVIVGIFIVSWGLSWALYWLNGYDKIDASPMK